ncbi:MAG: hypothetical protein HeimC2_13260 [Candidatus Heimdallarchaeota archaeon LC_2]|nr:MAG: hypothetical protein HeimC2_13260 [Candidatus Heimdallarchaeota archaeon LC_2]
MKVRFNNRGNIFFSIILVLITTSVIFRSPPLILLATFSVGYIIGYPVSVRNLENPRISLKAKFRHGILYRGEVEILKIEIHNLTESTLPLVKLQFDIPLAVYLVDRPSEYIFGLDPNERKIFAIPLLPTARGSYIIGPIKLKLGDPFFLFESSIAEIQEIPFRIYPKRIGSRVSKNKSREVFSNLIGLFATKTRGIGTEFHGLREYIRGDPVKIIDWAASARANKLISKEYEQEKKLEVIIVIAAGTTTRGSKFDFMLGVAMDLYEGIIDSGHPAGLTIFDNEIIAEFRPSRSKRRKMQIWSQIFSLLPQDIYANYDVLSTWVEKKGITRHLFFIIGDLEYDSNTTIDCIRRIKMRNNNVIFFDVFGYPFSYQNELNDAAADLASDNYGVVLAKVIGKGIEHENVFKGNSMKFELIRLKSLYGYMDGPYDHVIDALERCLFSYFGKNWKVRSN